MSVFSTQQRRNNHPVPEPAQTRAASPLSSEQRTESEVANKRRCLRQPFKPSPSPADEPLKDANPEILGSQNAGRSPRDLTYRHESYLERWVILSDLDRHHLWCLGAVVSYCYQRVVDETRAVCGVPCRHQDQEPITSKNKRQTCSLLATQPGSLTVGHSRGAQQLLPPQTRPTPGAAT